VTRARGDEPPLPKHLAEPPPVRAVAPSGDERTSPTSEENMTITKPVVATVAILAAVTFATAPASARKHHHKMKSETQSEMTNKNKTTTGQSMSQMKSSSGGATNKESAGMGSSGSGPSGGPSGQASPKQTK
jgi:hypothetical protein